MPSKKSVKKVEKPSTEPKGEEIAGMILTQLNNIQTKLNDLNKRVKVIEQSNMKPMEYSSRLSKVEGRLGI